MVFLRASQLNPLTGVITLLLLGWLLHQVHLLQAVVPVIGFVWISYVIKIIFTFFYRLEMRDIEYRRDAYAFRLGFGRGLRQALQKLTKDPQPVNSFLIILRSSHPVIYNRIRRLEELEGSL
jgi:Zn-dependent protease with chaperone function